MLYMVGKIPGDLHAFLLEQQKEFGRFVTAAQARDDQPNTHVLDFSSPQSLEISLRELQPDPAVSGVMMGGYEHYVLPASIIAQHFGVPGMPPAAARAATDKIIMRERFSAHDPSITPAFAAVESWEDIVRFMQTHEFPVMLKPANLMKSLHITKNHSLEDLRRNYRQMLEKLPAVYKRYRQAEPRILIEACMVGSMHTVAGFVDSGGHAHLLDDIVDCVTASDIGKQDNYIFSRRIPTVLGAAEADSVKRVATSGVAALGLKNTAIHAELMLTNGGPKIIEIGARIGGYRPRMYEAARGISLYQAAMDTALGRPVQLQASRSDACTVLEVFAEAEGAFASVDGAGRISALPSYKYMRITLNQGEMTGRASAGFRAPLIVILESADPEQVERDSSWIQDNVRIRLRD